MSAGECPPACMHSRACAGAVAYATLNRVQAVDLFDELCKGMSPTVVSYTAAITACGNAGQVQKAEELFQAAMDNPGLSHSTYLFNALIKALMNSGEVGRAVEVFKQLQQHPDLECDLHTYTMMIRAVGAAGEWEQALQLLKAMKSVIV